MKAFIFVLTLALGYSNVHAAARAFRVEQVKAHNFATAYGFKGEMVDFEAIEHSGTAWEFMESRWEAGTFCNYLVDVRYDQILSESCGDFVDATFGEHSVGNHYDYDLTVAQVALEPMDWSADYSLLIESTSMKWFGGISSILVNKRERGESTVVAKCESSCLQSLQLAIDERLTPAQRELMQELGANYFDLSEVELADYSRAIKYVNTYYVPKSEDTQELEVSTLFKAKLVNSKLVFQILEVSAKVIE